MEVEWSRGLVEAGRIALLITEMKQAPGRGNADVEPCFHRPLALG